MPERELFFYHYENNYCGHSQFFNSMMICLGIKKLIKTDYVFRIIQGTVVPRSFTKQQLRTRSKHIISVSK